MSEEAKRIHETSVGHVLVGLFVVVALVGFAWLLVMLRQGPEHYALVAEFDSLGSIDEATKVKLRGFTVGKVDGIEFQPSPLPGEPYFLVRLGIEEGYPVPEGTVAEIRSSGLVGEAHIDLDVTEAGTIALQPGAHLPGRADPVMKSLMEGVRDAALKLGGAGRSIRDADLGGRLGDLVGNITRIAEDLERVTSNADSLLVASRHVVVGMEPGLLRSLESLDHSMARLAQTMDRADTLVAATSQDVRASVTAVRQMVERLDQLLGRIDTLVQSKEVQIDQTLNNLHETSSAVRDLSQHPWRLVIGGGDGRVAEEMDPPADGP